ncbi:MAG: DNA polymerase, partial [Myxococcota bacterium]
ETGRLHPRFKSGGASTGRASCSEPNLQSIPSSSGFRACFRAPRGRVLITADYVGAELRIIADRSREPFFLQALGRGEDLHALVARRLFRQPVSKTENPELRARAKAINFGLAYGMGPGGLANQLGCRPDEAEQLLEAYFRAFPRVRAYLEDSAQQGLRQGWVASSSGRRYWLTDMRREGRDEGALVRVAKNMPIQGTNADMVKIAMARLVRAFAEQRLDARLVNMVHDEIVVEADESAAEAIRGVMVNEMMSAGAEFVRQIPMTVDTSIAEAWSK